MVTFFSFTDGWIGLIPWVKKQKKSWKKVMSSKRLVLVHKERRVKKISSQCVFLSGACALAGPARVTLRVVSRLVVGWEGQRLYRCELAGLDRVRVTVRAGDVTWLAYRLLRLLIS